MKSAYKNAARTLPFFPLTNTLLVEAENEHDAAHKAAAQIRSGRELSVSIQSDETTVTHLTVAATVDEPHPVSTPAAEATDHSLVAPLMPPSPRRPTAKSS